ncbi:MAG: nickel-dependent hydrogenase large subunit [Deltaproteobacteria bacterium]|nr:nickel-dependent hydrogenase large subunit [Deltaproteobacteria bacterium]
MTTRTIKIDYLGRVEGEGALGVHLRGDKVERLRLDIFEPPRLFEGFLRGRLFTEVPDITSRVCGICPVAYQLSSAQALEDALGVEVEEPIRQLRRLIYCGEWIESHGLHVFMLHAPDFLGFTDGFSMAREHPKAVQRALGIKKTGNALVALLGGRAIHPVNTRVGGFHRAPSPSELRALLPELEVARDAMRESLQWLSGFDFPEFEREYEFVALSHPSEYPFCDGRLASSSGLDISVRSFDQHFTEEQVDGSTALRSSMRGRGAYLCGPLARFNLSFSRLSTEAQDLAREIGVQAPCRNPFKSLLVRGIEIFYALDEAMRLIERYRPPQRPFAEVVPREATGYGCTEAPRGILYHRYSMDAAGVIREARIVPPTTGNLRSIEEDLRRLGPELSRLSPAQSRILAARAVRNHDPCISCSTH